MATAAQIWSAGRHAEGVGADVLVAAGLVVADRPPSVVRGGAGVGTVDGHTRREVGLVDRTEQPTTTTDDVAIGGTPGRRLIGDAELQERL